MSARGGVEDRDDLGLLALTRSDLRRQVEMFGWKRVPVAESFWLSVDFRIRDRISRLPPGTLRTLLVALEYPFHKIIRVINHSSIGVGTKIGPGLLFAHFGGVWIHPRVEIGSDCTIFHQVTITTRGGRADRQGGVPRIGDRVRILPGAKLLGRITVGDDVVIGANAVVLEDVPSGAVVAGNPARVVRMRD